MLSAQNDMVILENFFVFFFTCNSYLIITIKYCVMVNRNTRLDLKIFFSFSLFFTHSFGLRDYVNLISLITPTAKPNKAEAIDWPYQHLTSNKHIWRVPLSDTLSSNKQQQQQRRNLIQSIDLMVYIVVIEAKARTVRALLKGFCCQTVYI